MKNCERLETCAFFQGTLARMPRMAEDIKKQYCTGVSAGCARLMVAKVLGPEQVPPDLFPFSRRIAERIIVEAARQRPRRDLSALKANLP